MQTGLIIYLNRARIKGLKVNNKLQNDFFIFWFQKLRLCIIWETLGDLCYYHCTCRHPNHKVEHPLQDKDGMKPEHIWSTILTFYASDCSD